MTANRNLSRRLWEMIRPYRWKLSQCFVLLLGLTTLGLITPLFGAKIIGVALPEKNLNLFLTCLVGLLITQLLHAGLSLWNGHVLRMVGGRVVFDLRRRMYKHLQHLSLSFYESRGSGEIMARLMNDVASITTLVTGTALNTIVSVCSGLAILGLLFYIDWVVALTALAVMPLHFLSWFAFKRRLSHQSWMSSEKTSQIYGKANEVLDAAKMVKAYSCETREIRTLITQLREGYEIDVKSGLLANTWGWASNLISNWGVLLVMLVCGSAVVLGRDLTVEKYILLMGYVAMLYAPIAQLVSVAHQIIPAKVGMQRVFEILDMEPEVDEMPMGLRKPLTGDVVFQGVGFAYPNGKQVLTDICFHAKPGEMIALVGPSGSGKTTIANLIARFYDRTHGSIKLDGVDIQDYAMASLRNQMSMVLQETHLFRGTIRENLLYGKPDATEEQIIAAARLANAHEFIQAMPNGYDTVLGSRGARLSGGQRQRIAIARALIRDPKLLILDEATSALDAASEAKVQEALDKLMADRTTFVIAHRLSTIKNADRILVLDNGHIVQSGTHEELMVADGLYRKLYDPEWAKQREAQEESELRELAAVA
jgi:subfamily B ATP-binding cassette protein MsbA